MKIKLLLKEWKIWVLLIAVMYSIFVVFSPIDSGVIVTSVADDSPLKEHVKIGDKISWMNEKVINDPKDLEEFETFTGVLRYDINGKLVLTNIERPGLGIKVSKTSKSKLNMGMDITGGTRVILEPVGNASSEIIEQAIATLQTRINLYGLKETKFQKTRDVSGKDYIQIEMAGGSIREVEDLLSRQGKFEAKISKPIKLVNGKALFWGSKIEVGSCDIDCIIITNPDNKTSTLKANESSVKIDGMDFKLMSVENSTVVLLGHAFDSDDIESVCIQEQAGICISRVIKRPDGWEFNIQLFVSEDGAKRFAKLTKDSEILHQPDGSDYLDSKLYLFLDDEMIDELTIASGLAGQAYRNPVITGFREDRAEALSEKLRMQSILQSGVLPIELKIIKVDQISASLGQDFIESAVLAGIAAALGVAVVIFVRYRKIKIVIPVILTSLSEVLIILGAAAIFKWTIDLAAIAGIIAAVGTGVDSQIMIIDEILMKESEQARTLKQKIKRAFFIIFGSATTTIAAMIPLMVIGISVMRGFAIVASIGVLIGILITRPAFGRISEILIGNSEQT